MRTPRQLFETGDPITADFSYIRWLSDRKRIEEITTVWNKLLIGGTAEMEEWIPTMEKLLKRRLAIDAAFNNDYGGAVFESARLFREMLDRRIGKQNAKTARRASTRDQQADRL